MSLGLGMGMGLELNQTQELRHEQRLVLKQLMRLSLELRHDSPEYTQALRGVEGIKTADAILKRNNLRGVLIGGLSEVVWNPRRRKKDFDFHKDVDVAVLGDPNDIHHIERLEGGIDWWLPQRERLSIRSDYSSAVINKDFWENAFGVRLSFGIVANDVGGMKSGLHIPHQSFVIDMRVAEAMVNIDESVMIDTDVEDAFREKLEKGIKDEMSSVMKRDLGDCPIDKWGNYLRVERFSREEDIAIKNSNFITVNNSEPESQKG